MNINMTPMASMPSHDVKSVFIPESDDHEFFHKCEEFDWYFAFSDDSRVVNRGESDMKNLKTQATNERRLSILEAWHRYKFSGPNFGTELSPKPIWENFIDA